MKIKNLLVDPLPCPKCGADEMYNSVHSWTSIFVVCESCNREWDDIRALVSKWFPHEEFVANYMLSITDDEFNTAVLNWNLFVLMEFGNMSFDDAMLTITL